MRPGPWAEKEQGVTGFEKSLARWPVLRNIISSSSSVVGFGHVGRAAPITKLGTTKRRRRDSVGVMMLSGSL